MNGARGERNGHRTGGAGMSRGDCRSRGRSRHAAADGSEIELDHTHAGSSGSPVPRPLTCGFSSCSQHLQTNNTLWLQRDPHHHSVELQVVQVSTISGLQGETGKSFWKNCTTWAHSFHCNQWARSPEAIEPDPRLVTVS